MGSKDNTASTVAKTVEENKVPAATAPSAPPTPAAKGKAKEKGSYTVKSPIKHDGEDYDVGDTIRLPEATAARLAGFLEA